MRDSDALIRNSKDLEGLLHTGGITKIVQVPRELLADAINVLTTCGKHDASHVFVVDQSGASRVEGGSVRVGVSEHGLACLEDNF